MFRQLLMCLAFLATAATAQDRPRAILVLDASGSMWGQIDGTAKITIAQQVIGDLLQTLPAEQVLGLTAYGHRRKGDCSDIETVIPPEGDQRAAIGAAVNGFKPKGKTPMTDAVIAAAEALKYTEEAATVILVSDGVETCNPDPCAAARRLEETGVNFTAHVIGFDVGSDANALAQMQCLAEETGGTFRTAANAAELGDALSVVAAPVPPEPKPFYVTFNAKEGPGGPTITRGLIWTVATAGGDTLLEGGGDQTPTLELLPGDYTVSVLRDQDGATAERGFAVDATHQTVVVVLPELPPDPVRVTVFALDGENGPVTGGELVWDLTDGDGNAVVSAQMSDRLELDLTRGEYVVSVLRVLDEASAEQRFGVGQVNKTLRLALPEYRPAATLEAPEKAIAGELVPVRWTGPDAQNDFIAIAGPEMQGGQWENYTYTREGPLLDLRMPPTPGRYEIRYILSDGRKVLASRPIEVTGVEAGITPPAELPAGATVQVDWTGPDYQNDFIAVTERGEEGWINYTYTREGSPLGLLLPGEPGEYDFVYTLNQDREIIARVPVKVTGVSFSVTAPASAPAGSKVPVDWAGPGYRNDFISVAEIGSDDGKWLGYTYTREGSPLDVTMPLQPGRYEIRYVLSQGRAVQARAEIEVTAVTAGLKAPEAAPVGGALEVYWQGPDYQNDYIAITPAGEDELKYDRYTYTREGSPLDLQLPATPGDYVLRYIAAGNPKRVLASKPIRLTEVAATLSPPASAPAGGQIQVAWDGPGNPRDYIAIGKPGERYFSYAYVDRGNPATLKLPPDPGEWELRYVLNSDRRIIATMPLTVE